MLLNNAKESSIGTYIGVQPNSTSISQVDQTPSICDYLTAISALITAVTPLILRLRKKSVSNAEDNDND
jgi:hypothetical protein